MTEVEYTECQHCGEVIPFGRVAHTARRRTYLTEGLNRGLYRTDRMVLCCKCYVHVGGTCDTPECTRYYP